MREELRNKVLELNRKTYSGISGKNLLFHAMLKIRKRQTLIMWLIGPLKNLFIRNFESPLHNSGARRIEYFHVLNVTMETTNRENLRFIFARRARILYDSI